MLETRVDTSISASVAVEAISGVSAVGPLLLALSPSLPAGGSFVNCGHRCPPNALQVLSGHAAMGAALGTAVRILFAVSAIGVAMLLLARSGPRAVCAAARSRRWPPCSSRA